MKNHPNYPPEDQKTPPSTHEFVNRTIKTKARLLWIILSPMLIFFSGNTVDAGDEKIAALDVRIDEYQQLVDRCSVLGYSRQKQYWELRKSLELGNRESITLQNKILALQQIKAIVPQDLAQRMEAIQKRQNLTKRNETQAAEAQAAWNKVDTMLRKVEPDYSWHQVKVNLLRDLMNRARRIKFYLLEAAQPVVPGKEKETLPEIEIRKRLAGLLVKDDAAAYNLGFLREFNENFPFAIDLEKLSKANRQWEDEYGECYFGRLEQPLAGQVELAGDLAKRAEQLAQKLVDLNNEREALTSRILGFLKDFDKDGKFGSLSIPYRKKDIKVAADGTTSDLLFCGLFTGGSAVSPEAADPLCFDITDIYCWGFSAKARGILDLESLKPWLDLLPSKADRGYYFKLPLRIHQGDIATPLAAPKLLEKNQNDKNHFLRNCGGNYGNYVNIWHPEIRRLLQDNLAAVANYAKDAPHFLFYDKLTWEPAGLVVGAGAAATEGGYNPEAISGFRQYLTEKFRKISRLNKAWRTGYPDFEAIEPPADPFAAQTPRTRATPLTYEWETFRQKSYSDYLKMCVDALHKNDPDHPVAVEIGTMINAFVAGTAGAYRRMIDIPAQYIEDHYNNWPGNYPSLNLLYSLCLYAGKLPIETEYIWTFPRLIPPETEDDLRVTGELSVWRKAVWGRKILHVFGDFDGWGYRHNFMEERFCQLNIGLGQTGNFVREAAAAIPVGKKRTREFWPYLNHTEVVKPKIAILVPATSDINAYPHRTPSDWPYPGSSAELYNLSQFLFPIDMDFRYVPEEVIVSGRENLNGFKAIILPYAAYFPDGLAKKLLKWTKKGGALIAFGVPGIYDPYGFDNPVLMSQVFGSQLGYNYAEKDNYWRWNMQALPGNKQIQVIQGDTNKSLLVSTRYGDGTFLLSGMPFDIAKHGKELQASLARAIGWPTACSARHSFEMVMRADKNGQRYLFIANPSLRKVAVDFITVDGEYRELIDLGIGSHCKIPLVPRDLTSINTLDDATLRSDGSAHITTQSVPARTTFQMRLAPGEGTVLKLVK